MSVSKQDRQDYEKGLRDREKGVFEQVFDDITANHTDNPAYYKGRKGEDLDEDKHEEKD